MKYPYNIEKAIGSRACTYDGIGLSDSQVIFFDDMVLKTEKTCFNSENELCMMQWLQGRLPVPEVLAFEQQDGFNYLLMSRMPGSMLCSDEILDDPDRLLHLMTEALHMLASVDITGFPGGDSLDRALEEAGKRVASDADGIMRAHPDTFCGDGSVSPELLYRRLLANRPETPPVFSHGDLCLPNILTDGHSVTGFIDLGAGGLADRHQDIAMILRSMRNNLGGVFGGRVRPPINPEPLLSELNADPQLLGYFDLLDDLF